MLQYFLFQKNYFFIFLFLINLLINFRWRFSYITDSDKDRWSHEIHCQILNRWWNGCTAHKCYSFFFFGHVNAIDNLPYVFFEPHVKHAITLIQYQEFDWFHTNTACIHEIFESTWTRYADIHSSAYFVQLLTSVSLPSVAFGYFDVQTESCNQCTILNLFH